MFNLDDQLSKWRKQLLGGNVYSPSDIEELESHVLDSMDDLMENKELTQEEAFWVAIHRIGNVDSLNGEFGKTNGWLLWRRRIIWLLAGYVIISTINNVIASVPQLFFALGAMAGLRNSVLFPANIALRALLICGVIVVLFSKKIWEMPTVGRGLSLVRNHYLVFSISALIFAFAVRVLLSSFLAYTMSKYLEHQSSGISIGKYYLTNVYFNGAWNLTIYIVFFILLGLLARARKAART